MRRKANNFCYGTGLDLCTSTNPYVGESCGYGIISKKKDAKCPKCRCQIIEGTKDKNYDWTGYKACGIGSNDDHCNPSKNQ
jgi:hypothetical protein